MMYVINEDLIAKYNNFFNQFKDLAIDREREIEIIKRAVLMSEHILLEGRAGLGKTYLASKIFSSIEGANNFKIQFSKFMEDTELFNIDYKKLREEGKLEYREEDSKILNAQYTILDEFYDGNDSLLRALNSILNERLFLRNNSSYKVKLKTAILTSNYERDSPILEAVKDRILFKIKVNELEEDYRLELLKNNFEEREQNLIKINEREIEELRNKTEKIKIKIGDIKILNKVITELKKTTYISDRTSLKLLKLLKVEALLNAREEVTEEDIRSLSYIYGEDKTSSIFYDLIDKIKIEEKQLEELNYISREIEEINNKTENTKSIKRLLKFKRDISNFLNDLDVAKDSYTKENYKLERDNKTLKDTIREVEEKIEVKIKYLVDY